MVQIDKGAINAIIKNSNPTADPYFLLLLTKGGDNNIIVQAANQTTDNLSADETFTKDNRASLDTVIKEYINSSTLNTIFASGPAAVAGPAGPAATPTADFILTSYDPSGGTKDIDSAVRIINDWILANGGAEKLKNADDSEAVDKISFAELSLLLKLPNNEKILKTAADAAGVAFAGGSRSMKHRRRHRKKNKNTKRRSRK